MSLTDPTGLCFLGCFWQNSTVRAVIAVAVAIFMPYALYGFSFAVFTDGTLGSVAALTAGGAASGAISANGGNIVKGALFGGIQAAAMAALAPTLGARIGGMIGSTADAATAGRFIASGMIGGLTSVGEGGRFGSGFLAAGFGSLAGALDGGQFNTGKLLASAALGGIGSILGGGKFANGAVTGAFAYAAETCAAGGCGTEDIGGNGPPADARRIPIFDPNDIPSYLTRNGNTITGTVNVYCASGIDCTAAVQDLANFNNGKYSGGYDINITFQVAAPGTPAQLSIIHDFFDENCGATALACAVPGGRVINVTSRYSGQEYVLDHEYGHILGFYDSLDSRNLMFWNTGGSAHGYLNQYDAERLINAYKPH